MLKIGGGGSRTDYRNFSSTPVTGGAVYVSALIRCSLLPTNAQFIASLMTAGNTSPNQSDDPLDLYVAPAPNGFTFQVSHNGGRSGHGFPAGAGREHHAFRRAEIGLWFERLGQHPR